MKFSQPLVLLLGSVLSASGIGCSAITAVVSDSRPANRENHGDADRLAAIGRVFENQGRYDKAEVMYRKALKNRPQDPAVRNQLQQLAARRKEQKFGPAGTADAIAMADAVSPPKSGVQRVYGVSAASAATLPTAPVSIPDSGQQPQIQPQLQMQPQPQWNHPQQTQMPASSQQYLPSVTPASLKPDMGQGAEFAVDCRPAPASNKRWHSSQSNAITGDDILVALESPDDHVDMLLKAMNIGDNPETKALAATLLGDCDPGNTRVRDALKLHQGIQSDPEVLIALCDSQIERNEADQQTANCLVCLCTGFSGDTQIQAASQLRSFAGTEHESACLTALNELLDSEEPSVRATSALTLGDFTSLEDSTRNRLQDLANADSSVTVRDAAQSALTRLNSGTLKIVPASRVTAK